MDGGEQEKVPGLIVKREKNTTLRRSQEISKHTPKREKALWRDKTKMREGSVQEESND